MEDCTIAHTSFCTQARVEAGRLDAVAQAAGSSRRVPGPRRLRGEVRVEASRQHQAAEAGGSSRQAHGCGRPREDERFQAARSEDEREQAIGPVAAAGGASGRY